MPLTRVLLGAAAALLAIAAVATQWSEPTAASPAARPIADQLRAASWAMTLPTAWLAAQPPRARPGDTFDLLALRSGERSIATPVAFAVVLMVADDRGMTLQVDQDDAVAIADARAAGMQFIALLRSTR